MNTTPTDELEERLHERIQRLAAQVPAPMVPAEADLDRGRRRRRRQRLASVGVGAATLAVIGVVGTLTLGPGGSGTSVQQVQPASGVTSPEPAARDDAVARLLERVAKRKADSIGRVLGRSHPGSPDPTGIDARLNRFRAAVADALDPQGAHLDGGVTNQQVSRAAASLDSGSGSLLALGTKLGWTAGGGEGEILVNVARGMRSVGGSLPFTCAPGATGGHPCTPVTLPDGTTGRQQRYGDTLAVFHTRPDGQVVLIAESALFGNNSTVPIAKLPATAEQLLRVASDPRLTLDG